MDEQKRWRWMEVGVVFCSLFLFDFVNAINSFLAVEARPPVGFWSDFLYLGARSLQAIVLILFLIHSSSDSWASFGFVKPRLVDVGKGFLVMLLASFAAMTVEAFLYGFFYSSHGFYPDTARGAGGLESAKGVLIPVAILAVFTNSLAEEFAARSFLITRFEQLYNSRWIALLLSSALFASYHIYQGLIPAIGIFIVGLIYGAAFIKTRNVWVVVSAHTFSLIFSFGPWWLANANSP